MDCDRVNEQWEFVMNSALADPRDKTMLKGIRFATLKSNGVYNSRMDETVCRCIAVCQLQEFIHPAQQSIDTAPQFMTVTYSIGFSKFLQANPITAKEQCIVIDETET